MPGLTYRHISCLITNSGVVAKGGVRPSEQDLGLIRDGAVVFDRKKGILWSGADTDLPREFRGKAWKNVDARGYTAYPGLVDPHTHPAFLGDRSLEFELRMRGATYQSIAAAGGGIANSVANTRKGTKTQLANAIEARFRTAFGFGVRLLEAKSGYGLDFTSELRSLEAIDAAAKKVPELSVVSTCLAAHAIPPEFTNDRKAYISLVTGKILPAVAKRKLASYIDVFCDEGYFTVEETLEICAKGRALGFHVRLHGEELARTGIAEKGAEAGAHSIDHLLKINEAGIRAMAEHGCVGILLPCTSFYLKEAPAPARKLIDQGVAVALASDFNPGSSPTQNLPFVGTLAAIHLGMTTAEIIAALTWNGARSLRRENEYGALLPGYHGKPAFAEGDHPSALFYRVAPASLPNPESFT